MNNMFLQRVIYTTWVTGFSYVPLQFNYQEQMEVGYCAKKSATVCPVFKKGNKSDPGNYRPVSLMSVPWKVMESIIKDTVMVKKLRKEWRFCEFIHYISEDFEGT